MTFLKAFRREMTFLESISDGGLLNYIYKAISMKFYYAKIQNHIFKICMKIVTNYYQRFIIVKRVSLLRKRLHIFQIKLNCWWFVLVLPNLWSKDPMSWRKKGVVYTLHNTSSTVSSYDIISMSKRLCANQILLNKRISKTRTAFWG